MSELKKTAEELKLDVLYIQEPYSSNDKLAHIPVQAGVISCGNNPMAALVIYNAHLQVKDIAHPGNLHTNCIEITCVSGRFVLIDQYYQYSHDVEPYFDQTRNIFRQYASSQIIFTFDANAKSDWWHSNTQDDRGEKLE